MTYTRRRIMRSRALKRIALIRCIKDTVALLQSFSLEVLSVIGIAVAMFVIAPIVITMIAK